MENEWLRMAKRLHAIAETGMAYTEGQYDAERYREISQIAMTLLARLADRPIARIADLVDHNACGYATPKVDVRGALFRDNRILLVRELSDGRWTLPGGFADVGLSAAENVIKEVEEEAGLNVRVARLYSIRHKAKGEYTPDVRDFYKLFFLCEEDIRSEPVPGTETSDAAFFALNELPPLSTGRTVASDVLTAWEFHCDASKATHFD